MMSLSPPLVVDTSVLVAGMRPSEIYHTESRTLLEMLGHKHHSFYLPIIALAEVAAAISRVTDNTEQAHREVALVRQLPGLILVPVDVTLGEQAAMIAAGYRIRGCDAVYVALALTLNATLITLDRQQCERSPQIVIAKTPGELLASLPR